MTTTILDASQPQWDEVMNSFHVSDVYFERGYCTACAAFEQAEAYLFVFEMNGQRVVFPFLKGTSWSGRPDSDIWSPYGYAGPLASSDCQLLASSSVEAFDSFCRRNRVVTSFTRFHPLLDTHRYWRSRLDATFVRHTCYIDLTSTELVIRNMKSECRNLVRKACRHGLGFRVVPWDEGKSVFLRLYDSTMSRLEAKSAYRFSTAYFSTLAKDLAESMWVSIVDQEGYPCAAALLLRHRPFVHYHLSGWDPQFRQCAPNNLLIYNTAVIAAEMGYRFFHLGGGYEGDDSLYHFKVSFNPHGKRRFLVGKWIHMPAEYEELCDFAGVRNATPAFFPPYRQMVDHIGFRKGRA